MTAIVLRGDARALPLPDASVDLIVTSPPYYGLRSYTDGGQHYAGQIGSEATPAEWLQVMLACTREWMRVLKPTGSIFVNLGDTYSGKANAGASVGRTARADHVEAIPKRHNTTATAPYKSLLCMPERYRIACIDELGLTLRAVMIWNKPNGLPESVTDRVRRSHEDWVHLTLGPRYFAAVDEIREPHRGEGLSDSKRGLGYVRTTAGDGTPGDRTTGSRTYARDTHALGRLPGSVWEIPSEPLYLPAHLGLDHFAAFPTEWPRRIILGWSPSGICTACGEGRRPVATAGEYEPAGHGQSDAAARRRRIPGEGRDPITRHGEAASTLRTAAARTITSETCACLEPTALTRPSVVVDPFGGTGTTALVAHALGRIGITVDRSADYCRIAAWRTTDPGQIAKAMRVDKPPIQLAGQGDLFADLVTVPALGDGVEDGGAT